MTAVGEILADEMAKATARNQRGEARTSDQVGGAWRGTVDDEGFTLEETPPQTEKITNWDGVLQHFGLDPEIFEVVDDTVRISSWQQSKASEDLERTTVWLYSYKARFTRIKNKIPGNDLTALHESIMKWKPLVRKAPGSGLGAPSTFYVGLADWQYGKSAGGGVEVTTQAILDTYEEAVKRLKELRKIGRNVEAIAMWNMGDPTEECDGHYDSQLATVELTRREQLLGVSGLWAVGIKTLAPLVDDFEFGSVLCNHGEWTRKGPGSKPVTSDSDNIGGYLAENLKMIFDEREDFSHVRWNIPHDEMTVTSEMSGVLVALAHGHKTPGTPKELDWLRGQSIRILREEGVDPRLWMTAHRHHYQANDFGAWTRLQHPSLDGGSKWYTDTSGQWSTAGTLTCLVGLHDQAGGSLQSGGRGYSDELILNTRP